MYHIISQGYRYGCLLPNSQPNGILQILSAAGLLVVKWATAGKTFLCVQGACMTQDPETSVGKEGSAWETWIDLADQLSFMLHCAAGIRKDYRPYCPLFQAYGGSAIV